MRNKNLDARKVVWEACQVLWAAKVQPTVEEIRNYWEIECKSEAQSFEERLAIDAALALDDITIAKHLRDWRETQEHEESLSMNDKIKRLKVENRKLRERLEALGVDPFENA